MKGTNYFSLLSGQEQDQFRYNLENDVINRTLAEYLNCEFYDFNEFIGASFSWCESREGAYYWSDISNREVNAGLMLKKYIKKVELC